MRLSITEGRYHQVRRMFAALGNRVLTLHRGRTGGLVLDPSLQPGDWRYLTELEREAVLRVRSSTRIQHDADGCLRCHRCRPAARRQSENHASCEVTRVEAIHPAPVADADPVRSAG